MKKVMMLAVVLLGMAGSSHCVMLTFTIPGKEPVTFDTAKELDTIWQQSIQNVIADQTPFILAVIPTGKGYDYFDAANIMLKYQAEASKFKHSEITNPNTGLPITEIYFFTVADSTATSATYLCSNKDIFSDDLARVNKYKPTFDAYLGKDNYIDTLIKRRQEFEKSRKSPEEIEELRRVQIRQEREASERQRAAQAREQALADLKNYFADSPDKALKTKSNINNFTLGMLRRLDYLETTVQNASNNRTALREIAEAKEHINAVTKGTRKLDTDEHRQQFRDRIEKFVDTITELVNQLQ